MEKKPKELKEETIMTVMEEMMEHGGFDSIDLFEFSYKYGNKASAIYALSKSFEEFFQKGDQS